MRPAKAPAVADDLTIAAFFTVWFVPLAGLIMAHFANDAADQAGRRRHGLARATVALGTAGVIVWVIVIVALVASAHSGQPVYPAA
jgi:hypothetical protein